MLDAAFRSYVLGIGESPATAIAALVDGRMYPLRLPEKAALPAIVYQQISDTRDPHLRGPSGLSKKRYQVDCYAAKHPDARALGELVRQRLDTFAGTWTDDASPAIAIRVAVFFQTAIELFDEDIHGGSCRHSADYFVWHGTASGEV